MRIEELVTKRIELSKSSMAKSIRSMYSHLKQFDSDLIKVSQLDVSIIEAFKHYLINEADKRNGEPISKNSASSYFMAFRHCLTHAYRGGHTEKDLSRMVDGIPISETERFFLDKEEISMLMETDTDDKALKNISYVSLVTGMRFGDIISLRQENLKRCGSSGVDKIVFRQQKTGSLTELPVSSKTRDVVMELFKDSDFESYNYNRMNYTLKKWFEVSGVSDKKRFFHIFRHTFASMQIERGTDIFTIQDLMGHKSVNTTQVYARASFDNKINAILDL